MQICTLAVNYQGLPFREQLTDNKPLYKSLLGVGGLCFFAAAEFSPEINESLELVAFPSDEVSVHVGSYACDRFFRWLFERKTQPSLKIGEVTVETATEKEVAVEAK
jgi:manganese-transporting P-type ATPase